MGYYIRVLAESDAVVPVSDLRACLQDEGIDVILEVDDERWMQLDLSHPDGHHIAVIERNPVRPGQLGAHEIAEFIEDVADLEPESAARWLENYLPTVKVIYCFQLLSGTETGRGWDAVHAIQGKLWERLGGIMQAGDEGFSNREGYHIVWQFRDDVTGPWNMAVLDQDGTWTP